ncbi:MAG: glycosyltransferase [Thermoproteota archaeon]|jgi:glycosyltransferase involved in cell wall biosynthesis|nr:glycosyltransferase [Thermoproteota archaeon]
MEEAIKDLKRLRIAITHLNLSWYRIPLFKILQDEIRSDIIILNSKELPTYGKADFDAIEYLLKKYKISYKTEKVIGNNNFYFNPFLLRTLLNYDIIVWGEPILSLNSLLFIPTLKLFRKKAVLWVDDWGYKKHLIRKIFEPFVRLIYLIADGILVHGIKHYLYFLKLGVDKRKIFFIGNASTIFREFSSKDEIERVRRILNTKHIILYVGGLIKRKNVDKIIKAIYNLRKKNLDVGLLIVGQGPEIKSLYNLVWKMNLAYHIKFLGWIPFHRLANYYLAADVFVFPAENEPWGLVINEALEAGIPIVTTKSVGAEELIVNNINGVLINKIDEKNIADGITKCLSNKIDINNNIILKIKKKYNYKTMANLFINALLKIYYNKC